MVNGMIESRRRSVGCCCAWCRVAIGMMVETGRYCALLEQQLWRAYRRGASSYTPLLIPLPACKEPSKSAVEEPLRECGISSLAAALEGGGRRWLIILDGYDEVQGNTNFIVGNKLSDVAGVKVSRCHGGGQSHWRSFVENH